MKSVIMLVFLIVLAVASTRLVAGTNEKPVKIVVIGDSSGKIVEDMLTARLSDNKRFIVLDRSDLDKLASELEPSDSPTGDIRLARMLHAQGAIFFQSLARGGRKIMAIRLISVSTGITSWTTFLPVPNSAPERDAAILEKRLEESLGKLLVPEKDIVRISLLGLNPVLNTTDRRITARNLNILVAAELSNRREVFVLERWRMGDLTWEKSLGDEEKQFATGSFMVDGAIEESPNTGGRRRLSVLLRIRGSKASGGRGSVDPIPGFVDSLPELAKIVADKILRSIGSPLKSPIALNCEKEGEEYLRKAKLAYRSCLFAVAKSAVESSIALGGKTEEKSRLLENALCGMAYPDPGNMVGSCFYASDYKKGLVTRRNVASRLASARKALDFYKARFIKHHLTIEYLRKHPLRMALWVFLSVSRTLRGCYEAELFNENKTETVNLMRETLELSRDFQSFLTDVSAKLKTLPKKNSLGLKNRFIYSESKFYEIYNAYLPYFFDNPQKIINLSLLEIRNFKFLEKNHTQRILYQAADSPPGIADAKKRYGEELLKTLFAKITSDTVSSFDLRTQCYVYILLYGCAMRYGTLDDVGEARKLNRAFLNAHMDDLIDDLIEVGSDYPLYCFKSIVGGISLEVSKRVIAKCGENNIGLPSQLTCMLPRRYEKKAVAVALNEALLNYKKKTQRDSMSKENKRVLRYCEKRIREIAPEFVRKKNDPNEFFVDKAWSPLLEFGASAKYWISEAIVLEGKVWSLWLNTTGGRPAQIFIVDIDGGGPTERITVPLDFGYYTNNRRHTRMMAGNANLLVLLNSDKKVYVYDRKKRKWQTPSVPRKYFEAMLLDGNNLYLGFSNLKWVNMTGEGKEFYNSGLMKLDLKTGDWRVLASSIRHPPKTPLDGINDYDIKGLFKYDGKLFLAVVMKDGTYDIFQYDIPTRKLEICDSTCTFQELKILPLGRDHPYAFNLSTNKLAVRLPKRMTRPNMKLFDSLRDRSLHSKAILYSIQNGVLFFYATYDYKTIIKCYPCGKTSFFLPVRFKDKFEKFHATSGNWKRHVWSSVSNHTGLLSGACTEKHLIFYQSNDNLFWYADKKKLVERLNNLKNNNASRL